MYTITVRNKRQLTLPSNILKQLALSVGDKLIVNVENNKLVAKPVKNQVLDKLETIQKAFDKSQVKETELQKNGQEIRSRLVKKLYG